MLTITRIIFLICVVCAAIHFSNNETNRGLMCISAGLINLPSLLKLQKDENS